MEKILTNGSRIAKIEEQNGRWNVYVGIKADSSCPGEEIIGARWFKGFSTCSADFATERTAIKKANDYLFQDQKFYR